MCVVLGFTVRIRTSLQLHPFDMFQGLFVRYREPALDIHHDDNHISCWHLIMHTYHNGTAKAQANLSHAQARENLCNSPSQNMNADEHSNINQFKPSVLFAGHMQTVDTQTRRRTMRRLIRVSTVCLCSINI